MRALLTSALVICAAAAVVAQQATFRSDTRIVPVPTTVIDGDGRLVPDLTKDDFTILDNTKAQEITIFENSVEPFNAVVMLDFSGSMTAHLKLLRQATEQFLLRMLPQDQAQVGSFSDKIMFSGAFTNNRDRLIASLDNLQYGNPTALFDAIDQSMDRLLKAESTSRKVVVVFTDGDDNYSKVGFGAVRDRAREKDIMIYAIGLRSFMDGQSTRPDPNLRKLAEITGGGYFELRSTDELGPTFTRVAQELHSLYTMAFVPEKLDGKEHKIEVRLKAKNMKARARTSYLATPDDDR